MKKLYIILCVFFISGCTAFNQSEEIWIKNAQNEEIYVKIDGIENAAHHKLAVLQHGLASNMEHIAIRTAKKAFLDNHYVVITFDSRYSLGKGNNDVEKVRFKTFTEDLATVIDWAKKQPFYTEPFALTGHSLGGASVLEYSAEHPGMVDVLLPITPVISGKLWETSCMTNITDFCRQWQKDGTYQYTDKDNHKTAIIPYTIINSSMNYNAYSLAPKITAKTLLIAAQNDIIINPLNIESLSVAIEKSQTKIIKSAGHNFEEKQNAKDLYQTINNFLKD